MKQGILLLAHGSRDPLWKQPFEALRDIVVARADGAVVANAYLEHTAPDVTGAARDLIARGATNVDVIPLFLGPGGHVRNDLPRLLESLRSTWPDVMFRLTAPIGEVPEVLDAIATFCVDSSASRSASQPAPDGGNP